MEQTGNILHRQTGCRFMEPPLYDVVMHNDDVTTMDFVVGILKGIFRKGEAEAVRDMGYMPEQVSDF